MSVFLPHQSEAARIRLEFLIQKGATIEVTEKKKKRTVQQNRYLHLILGWFALEYGETLEYVKTEFFKSLSKDIFLYNRINYKTGEERTTYRSSREVDTRQMTIAIERFRDWSSQKAGIYLPRANEHKFLEEIEREMNKYNNNLYL